MIELKNTVVKTDFTINNDSFGYKISGTAEINKDNQVVRIDGNIINDNFSICGFNGLLRQISITDKTVKLMYSVSNLKPEDAKNVGIVLSTLDTAVIDEVNKVSNE